MKAMKALGLVRAKNFWGRARESMHIGKGVRVSESEKGGEIVGATG